MEKVWLKSYPKDVATEIDPDHYTSLVDLLEKAVHRYASRTAYICMGDIRTYAEIDLRSRHFAAYLQHIGLKKGDRVALMMPNLFQHPIALFGILRAGLIAVNVNPLYTPREMHHQLKDSGAKTIVVLDTFAATLQTAMEGTSLENIIISSAGDQLSFFKHHFINFALKFIKKAIPTYSFKSLTAKSINDNAPTLKQPIRFNQTLKIGALHPYNRPEMTGDDIAFLQYTGGTTGVAKGAMLTHRNMLANLEQSKAVFGPIFAERQQTIVTALPLYHVFALTVNCMLMLEMGGTSLLIPNPRDMKSTIKAIANSSFTAMTGVNTLFNSFLRQEEFTKLNFSQLRICVGGGMPVHRSVAEAWHKVTGCHLLEGYGLTECSPLVAVNPYNLESYNGSIGLPVPSTDIRLVNDNFEDVGLNERGELWVKGPQVMKGYWQNQAATDEIMQQDWLKTGDIAVMDELGFLRIVDRKKEMILVSGFNVYPSEIEEVIMQHPNVQEAAAIGIPHPATGESIRVCVVRKDETVTEEALIEFCRERLTGYKIPKKITFHDDLPKSSVGKILRREIKEQVLAEMQAN